MPVDPSLARRQRAIRVLACVVAALMLATAVLSAYMRLAQSGLDCQPWPACFAQAAAGTATADAGAGIALARLAHRVVASLVLVLVVLLVLAALAMRPRLRAEGSAALVLLLLTLALALLGATMRGSTHAAVVLGNLLGGFLMLAVATRLGWPAPAGGGALTALARLSLLLLLLGIALGALLSATRSTLACEGFAHCLQQAGAVDWNWRLLDPWSRGVSPESGAARGAWLQLLHRGAALALLPVLAALIGALWRAGRRAGGVALALLFALQWLAGSLLPAAAWPLGQVLAHNLSAALLLALLLRLA